MTSTGTSRTAAVKGAEDLAAYLKSSRDAHEALQRQVELGVNQQIGVVDQPSVAIQESKVNGPFFQLSPQHMRILMAQDLKRKLAQLEEEEEEAYNEATAEGAANAPSLPRPKCARMSLETSLLESWQKFGAHAQKLDNELDSFKARAADNKKLLETRVQEDLGSTPEEVERKDLVVKSMDDTVAAWQARMKELVKSKLELCGSPEDHLECVKALPSLMTVLRKEAKFQHLKDAISSAVKLLQELERKNAKHPKETSRSSNKSR